MTGIASLNRRHERQALGESGHSADYLARVAWRWLYALSINRVRIRLHDGRAGSPRYSGASSLGSAVSIRQRRPETYPKSRS
jgi:hypothetical protein